MQVFKRLDLANWVLPLLLALLAIAIMLGGETAAQWLRYDRAAIAGGEYWRVLTAHLTHLGWSHLLLNLAGLMLLQLLVGDALNPRGWLLLLLFSALCVSTGLWIFDPQVRWYVGLSGVLHGVLLGGALLLAINGQREGIYLLLVTLAKLGWEQFAGPMPGSEATAGGKVIVNAHLYGAIGGGVLVLLLLSRRHWRRRFVRI